MKRRQFLRSAGLAAAASAAAAIPEAVSSAAAAPTPSQGAGAPSGDRWSRRNPQGEPSPRRWREQRWLLDNVIRANGVDWDQSHTEGILRSCGLVAARDMAAVKQRVKKFADFGSAFESVARKREAQARKAEASGDQLDARTSYYIAAQCYAQAMWPIHEVNDKLKELNQKKRDTFTKYMERADHHIEWVDIPYRGGGLPAVFHLPPGYRSGDKVPVIVVVPGMDGFKEKYANLSDDPVLARGVGILAVEGPGYWEAPLRGYFVDVPGWQETGKQVMAWLTKRPEVDPDRIGMTGSSYGSFFSAVMLSEEPRYKCCAVHGTCYEPGGETIFNMASPTFKRRFMFMSGITDEDEFDAFRKTIDWRGYAEKVTTPYLVLAGGADQLCPTEYTAAFVKALRGPKQWLIYQDADHGVGGSPAASNGPNASEHETEWLLARLNGQPFKSERWYIADDGKVTKTAL